MINSENRPPPETFCIGLDLQDPNTFLQEGKETTKVWWNSCECVVTVWTQHKKVNLSYIHIPLVIQGHLTPIWHTFI